MRPMTLALAALLLAPLSPIAPAGAAEETDWRAAACADKASADAPIAGTQTVGASQVTRVPELPGVRITAERLDFSGVTCELLHATGALPAGAEVTAASYSYTTIVHLVVDGIDLGEVEAHQSTGSSTQLYSPDGPEKLGMPDPSELFTAIAYRPVESGVFPVSASIPPDWQGKPYTATYLRSEWSASFNGRALFATSFNRTPSTDRAARAASTKQIARAKATYAARANEIKNSGMSTGWKKKELAEAATTRSASIKIAHKTLRLALRGQRLAERNFKRGYSGILR